LAKAGDRVEQVAALVFRHRPQVDDQRVAVVDQAQRLGRGKALLPSSAPVASLIASSRQDPAAADEQEQWW